MLNDADLHGLVDGHLDPDRRAEVLRRAAASPRDRALVEDWQDQTDLIRAAFAGVEREPLPHALDLRPRPALHAVADATRDAGAPSGSAPSRPFFRLSRRRTVMALAVVGAVAGLAGGWSIARLPVQADRPAPSRAALDDERMIADRTSASLAFSDAEATAPFDVAAPLAVATIPDLSKAGFAFVDAEARGSSRRSLVFRYRNAAGERLAVGVLRSAADDADLVPRDAGYTWRSGHVAYAVFGTLAADRLLAVAAAIRASGPVD